MALLFSSLNFSDIDFLYGSGYGARVLSIADGDTITVKHKRRKEKIRLYGIDCPEKLQEFGTQAKVRATRLMADQSVSVIPVHRDRYGRIVAYVILEDGTNVNYALVSEGMAWWFRKYARKEIQFACREIIARTQRKGLWSSDDPVAPWEFRKGVSVSSRDDEQL